MWISWGSVRIGVGPDAKTESRNILQSALAKQSCRLASALSDHFHIVHHWYFQF